MSKTTVNLDDIRTFWGCVPRPEQATLRFLAELSATPAQVVPFEDVKFTMQLGGALPAEERTTLLFAYDGITTVTDAHPLCNDENGCVLLPASPYLGQIWSCMLLGGCQVNAPSQEPCFYALTAPVT